MGVNEAGLQAELVSRETESRRGRRTVPLHLQGWINWPKSATSSGESSPKHIRQVALSGGAS